MSSIEEAALAFKAWAAEKGILGYTAPEEFVQEPEKLTDISDVSQPVAAEQVLLASRIHFVGVDDEAGKVIVYTPRRIKKADIEFLPSELEGGYTVEFRYSPIPTIRPANANVSPQDVFTRYNNKYTCGSSVFLGNAIGAGTLGCLLKDKDNNFYGLSNNHVTGGCNYAQANLPIIAPGSMDVLPGGHDPFTVGHHVRALGLALGDPDNVDSDENLDASIFKLVNKDLVCSMQRDYYDTPMEIAQPKTGMIVEKVGRTTKRTFGRIVARGVGYEAVEVKVPQYGFRGIAYFSDCIAVEGRNNQQFAAPGDSGSLVTVGAGSNDAKSLGLVFAVNSVKSLTYVVPLDKILKKFLMDIVSGHEA